MDNPFAIVLCTLGVLLIVAGACVVIGRQRIARNMRSARVSKPSAGRVALLGLLQIGLGIASLGAAWLPAWRQSTQNHSTSIARLFEGLGASGGIMGLIVILLGLVALGISIRFIVLFLRSTRGRDQSSVQLSAADLRRIYLATTLLIIGVLALYTGVFMFPQS